MRLGTVICRDLDMKRDALLTAVSHGQVFLEGKALTREDLNAPIEDIMRGSSVRVFQRYSTVNGSRLTPPVEQLVFEDLVVA